ncbi:Conserved protein of uncharacterised function with PIN domain [Mycobacterium tuberculosis]|nr:Conserved protein of uncharacterised function with PIN domain [Mycobacterium tuberculosis]
MIVDTSAIIAILRDEDDAAAYADALANADVRRLSAASYLECGIVLDSQRDPVIAEHWMNLSKKPSSSSSR